MMANTITNINKLKRKLKTIRNNSKLNVKFKRLKIEKIETQIIEYIRNNNDLTDNEKKNSIKEFRIRNIQRDTTINDVEKIKKYNIIMSNDYNKFILSRKNILDAEPYNIKSYYDEDDELLGCNHYNKGCKLKTKCCDKWYVCKFCHDEKEYHKLELDDIVEICCMKCSTIQPLSNKCINNVCNSSFADYYCDKCKYHNNIDSVFHCDKCNTCIIGNDEDYSHCDKCNMCLYSDSTHKCIENRKSMNCPICNDIISNSLDTTIMLESCNHILHTKCFYQYITSNYKCPICVKTITDFGIHHIEFERYDEIINYEIDFLPDYMQYSMVEIYCNDCENNSETTHHFELHKCQNSNCNSYNTSIITINKNYYFISTDSE